MFECFSQWLGSWKSCLFLLYVILFLADTASVQAHGEVGLKRTPETRLSVHLDGSYVLRDIEGDQGDPDQAYQDINIPGMDGPTHGVFHFQQGMVLNAIEIAFDTNLNSEYLLGIHLHATEADLFVEEAFIESSLGDLPVRWKLGKFQSHFGYYNYQHKHNWLFVDATLTQATFFGEEGLQEKGAHIRWMPHQEQWNIGVEILEGQNQNSFGTQGFELGESKVVSVSQPNVVASWAQWKPSNELLLVSSLAKGRSHVLTQEGTSTETGTTSINTTRQARTRDSQQTVSHSINTFASFQDDSETSRLVTDTEILSLGWRVDWKFNTSAMKLTWQGELIQRTMDGRLYTLDGQSRFNRDQFVWVTEWVLGITPMWTLGIRLDEIAVNDQSINNQSFSYADQDQRGSMVLVYQADPLTLFKFQWNHDQSRELNERQTVLREWIFQFQRTFNFNWRSI